MVTSTINDGMTPPKTMKEEKQYYQFGMRIPKTTKQKIHEVKGPYISLTQFIIKAVDRAIAEQEEAEAQQKGVRGLVYQAEPPNTTASLRTPPAVSTPGGPSADER